MIDIYEQVKGLEQQAIDIMLKLDVMPPTMVLYLSDGGLMQRLMYDDISLIGDIAAFATAGIIFESQRQKEAKDANLVCFALLGESQYYEARDGEDFRNFKPEDLNPDRAKRGMTLMAVDLSDGEENARAQIRTYEKIDNGGIIDLAPADIVIEQHGKAVMESCPSLRAFLSGVKLIAEFPPNPWEAEA